MVSARFTVCVACVALFQPSAYALQVSPLRTMRSSSPILRSSHQLVMTGKGFGKPSAPPPPPPKKSEGAKRRDAAGSKFDKLKATGAPEYMVLIRTVGTDGPSEWMPVGGIAVPRSTSEDQALSIAIFDNEDDLLKGAFRAYPKLKSSTDKFEYGYRLKEFEDDPIKVASKEKTNVSDNPFVNWFNNLDSGLNTER